jgi:hypothetical protein
MQPQAITFWSVFRRSMPSDLIRGWIPVRRPNMRPHKEKQSEARFHLNRIRSSPTIEQYDEHPWRRPSRGYSVFRSQGNTRATRQRALPEAGRPQLPNAIVPDTSHRCGSEERPRCASP